MPTGSAGSPSSHPRQACRQACMFDSDWPSNRHRPLRPPAAAAVVVAMTDYPSSQSDSVLQQK